MASSDQTESALGSRLCATVDSEAIPLGTVLCARWSDVSQSEVGVLYSSGVLRIWNVISDVKHDFALYMPVAGLPGLLPSHDGKVASKRSVMPISNFSFVPTDRNLAARQTVNHRVAFSIQRTKRLFVVDTPAVGPAVDRFLSGSRVYECSPAVDGDVTTMQSWTVCAEPTQVSCVVVGCSTGSLHVWAVGSSLNPMPQAGTGPGAASPRMVKVASFTPAQAASMELGTASSINGAHAGRVRSIYPLAPVLPGQACSVGKASNVFATAGDDGRVKLWALTTAAPGQEAAVDSAAGPVSLCVHPLCEVPSGGVPCHALAACAWPWHVSSRSAPGIVDAASLYAQAGSRVLLACGSVEGVVSLWEVLLLPCNTDMTQARQAVALAPSVRLVTMASARSLDPITCLALSPPIVPQGVSSAPSSLQYSLAVASADGSLGLYRLDGSVVPKDVGHGADPLSMGGSPPVSLVLHGSVGGEGPQDEPAVDGRLLSALAQATACVDGAGHDAAEAHAQAHLITGSSAGREVSTALTVSALARLHRAYVSCAFNDGARVAPPGAGQAEDMTLGALMACTGGGEVQLWSRSCLPGDEEAVAAAARQAEDTARSAALAKEEHDRQAAEDAAKAARLAKEAADRAARGRVPPPPAPGPSGSHCSTCTSTGLGDDGHHRHEDDKDEVPEARDGAAGKATHGPPRPASPPARPRVWNDTEASRARLAAVGDTLRALRAARDAVARDASRSRSRGRSPARAYLRSAAADAVRSAYSPAPATTRARYGRSMTPVERARARVLATVEAAQGPRPHGRPAAPAIPPLQSQDSGVRPSRGVSSRRSSSSRAAGGPSQAAGAAGGLDDSWANLKGLGPTGQGESAAGTAEDVAQGNVTGTITGQGAGGESTVDPGALEASGAARSRRTGRRAAQDTDATAPVLADVTGRLHGQGMDDSEHEEGSEGEWEEEGVEDAAANDGNRSAGALAALRSRLSRRTAGPFLQARFRSPARLAATLARDAALNVRAASTLARELAGAADAAVEDHPEAQLMYRRAVGPPGGEPGPNHLVAPSLASTVPLALAIARLEAARFDEVAEVRAILRDRGVTDGVVREALVDRARARMRGGQGGQGPVEETGPDVPPSRVMDVAPGVALYGPPAALPQPSPHHQAEVRRARSRSKSLTPEVRAAAAATEAAILKKEEQQEPLQSTGTAGGSPGARGRLALSRLAMPRARPGETVTAADVLGWRTALRGSVPSAAAQARASSAARTLATPAAVPRTRPAPAQPSAPSGQEPRPVAPSTDTQGGMQGLAGARVRRHGMPTYLHGRVGDILDVLDYEPVVRATGMAGDGGKASASAALVQLDDLLKATRG